MTANYLFAKALLGSAKKLLGKLRARNLKLATAESCTGGLLAALLTEIPGSSEVFERGFVTYSNASKRELLGVKFLTLKKYGAVSEQTAREMALGALKHSGADISVAITGIAGPSGGSKEKPVGLTHIAAAYGKKTQHKKLMLRGTRSQIRMKAVKEALGLIEDILK